MTTEFRDSYPGQLSEYLAWLEADLSIDTADIGDISSREDPMEDLEDDHGEPLEDELFIDFIEALAGDAPLPSGSMATLEAAVESRIRILNFERDQAQAVMTTALASRDIVYAGRDATLAGRNVAFADRDVHQDYAEEVIGQARRVLDGQDETVRTALILLGWVEAVEQELDPFLRPQRLWPTFHF